MNDIAKLLGTKNKKEQAQRVEDLQQAVAIQPVDLIVRYDPRVNQVIGMAAIGGPAHPRSNPHHLASHGGAASANLKSRPPNFRHRKKKRRR